MHAARVGVLANKTNYMSAKRAMKPNRNLLSLFVMPHAGTDLLYACVVDMEDNLERKSDGGFNRDEYMQFPDRYRSTFSTKV